MAKFLLPPAGFAWFLYKTSSIHSMFIHVPSNTLSLLNLGLAQRPRSTRAPATCAKETQWRPPQQAVGRPPPLAVGRPQWVYMGMHSDLNKLEVNHSNALQTGDPSIQYHLY